MAENPNISPELPLRKLFDVLREEAGIVLGLGEYMDLVKALQAGHGIDDLDSLRRLCCLLWAHSVEDQWKVRHHFDRLMAQASAEPSPKLPEKELDEKKPSPDPEIPKKNPNSPTTNQPTEKDISEATAQRKQAAERAIAQVGAITEAQTQVQQQRKRYLMRLRHTHIGERQLAQAWRRLRRQERTGPKTEFDLAATIRDIARSGHFISPILQKQQKNQADLRFLIDRDGSMVPFHSLSQHLVNGAQTIGMLPHAEVRYFHDQPAPQVFRTKQRSGSQETAGWMLSLNRKHSMVVIVSDAGAARRNYDPARIAATGEFLGQLARKCSRIVWLNPLPRRRWEGTSAAEIAIQVAMFELSPKGLEAAIHHLRRKSGNTQKEVKP